MLARGIGRQVGQVGYSKVFLNVSLARTYATQKEKSKKKEAKGDISQVPVENIGVMADFYIPPRFTNSPIQSWPRLVWRRLGMFVVNTYSITKYKRETKLKLKFNDWKETGMEEFVRVNKVFAASCNKRFVERKEYISKQLRDVAGIEVIKSLTERAESFPNGSKIQWELVNIENNPKIVSFNALPDANNLTVYVQFIMKIKTKQKVTVTQNNEDKINERIVEDYLVYTLDPFADDVKLVGKLFESDHIRKVQPDASTINAKVMLAFSKVSADLYRSNPKQLKK